ncbi:hypothetical protein RM531_03250 [Salinisphaera sp. P385]|uniref:PepSY domain-containing protein n=1 Tax=Spectribacter acetivorans TaxID=3075603 RepID=A0ABU3B6K8_9GAMM|nr:hypothetical protein [Salinisphaera sp. P385]MDT0617477.1 hypothetical protein [Salinisphaera sp. P385]
MFLFNSLPKTVSAGASAAAAGLALSLSTAAFANGGVSERNIEMSELPSAVASTFKTELDGKSAAEVEEISYEGIVVLYEVEYKKNGEEREIYAYPSGKVAARHSHEEGE